MQRFDHSEAVALQWIQHRNGEQALFQAEYCRLRAAADRFSITNEKEMETRLNSIKSIVYEKQVCARFRRI